MSDPELYEITIPPTDEGAVKPWRKLLTGLDESKRGGFVCLGPWLESGAVYQLPAGTLIVGVDRTSDTARRVRLWRVTTRGELTVARDSTLKTFAAEFGDGIRKTLRTALIKYPPTGQAPRIVQAGAPVAPEPNRRDDRCARCNKMVRAGAGLLLGRPGAREVQHKPGECPPPRNQRGQACTTCGGWVDPGEGVLDNPAVGVWRVRHDGQCPPEAERVAPPPPPRRRNERADRCVRCRQEVGEGEGWLIPPSVPSGYYTVEHDGACPPSPAEGYQTWTITAGVPGRFHPVPGAFWTTGHVERVEVHEGGGTNTVPEEAPGRRPDRHGRVSMIGVVVGEDRPVYCRDEDGDQPADLIGVDGWLHTGHVRVATAEEAAPLLAKEAEKAVDQELRARAGRLLSWRYPRGSARYLPAAELDQELAGAELVELRLRPADHPRGLYDLYPDQVWIAEGRDWVMTSSHNGADGDDWSAINWHRHIALLHPMTDDLRRLVADLTARYGTEDPA
ncbi:hypothetical protein ACFVUY_37935 [Kitasatospora sp. NPDC058063]|uniref:hypothetical protein n=1 Tax=unclassified Kitasatospora TaxID=2633591 RepID=UPI0036DBDB49